jgi:peptidoglycan/LPS O-acetylase OafA/YrhL
MPNIFKIEIDTKRVYGLDILRCIAILCVLFSHADMLLPDAAIHYFDDMVLDGVTIFFVLSGFLIGGILIRILEKEEASFKILFNFWKRRWFRTLPNYFLILMVLTILGLLFTDGFTVWSIKRYFFFSQNLFSPHPVLFFPEAWSLSIEEWFYLLIPAAVFFIIAIKLFDKKRAVIIVALIVLIAVTLFRLYRYIHLPIQNYNDWDLILRKQVFTRLDSLMYGVIGAYIAQYYKASWIKYKMELLIAGIFILMVAQLFYLKLRYHPGFYLCVFSFSINSLATLFLLPFLSELKQGKGLLFRLITYMSLISYSAYLINLSLIKVWILDNIDLTSLLIYGAVIKYVLFWILTILLSILIYKYYEVPLTNLRDKVKR